MAWHAESRLGQLVENDVIAEGMSERIRRMLTKGEMLRVLELIDDSVRVRSADEYRALEPRLKELFEFEYFMCGMGSRDGGSDLKIGYILNSSYPEGYFSAYVAEGQIRFDPVVALELEAPRLYHLADILRMKADSLNRDGLDMTRGYGIKEGYSTGFRNEARGLTSIFSFMGRSLPRSGRSELILDLLGPHLHAALCRVAAKEEPRSPSPLSARETEVLEWIKAGKSTWQISMQLSLSEATVKFHVGNILKKLDAATRTQALAEAMHRGYISLD
jgi:LuxR family transcriptional regulator, quorum-sensing system regulator CviR